MKNQCQAMQNWVSPVMKTKWTECSTKMYPQYFVYEKENHFKLWNDCKL